MGTPVGPWIPTLMIALQPLSQSSWAGRLPDVAVSEPFWASSRDVPGLVAAGLARLWQAGDPSAPPVEPAWTVHGQPGFGAGTSNSTHSWAPAPGAGADGGPAFTASQSWGGVIDGGPDAQGGGPGGTVDGGDA